jgi:multicomponent Na+:H+ antiporter subunit D
VRELGQQVAALLYGAGALGVTFAGDFLTLLVFWELMAVASAWLIFARRRPESTRAGFATCWCTSPAAPCCSPASCCTTRRRQPALARSTAGEWRAAWLILAGVALNVALPPLHAWLPDAYPQATVTGAVFMSATHESRRATC